MFIYRVEVIYTDQTQAEVIVIHETEEKAFTSVKHHVDYQYLPPKQISEMSIVEKKPALPGRGYVVDL